MKGISNVDDYNDKRVRNFPLRSYENFILGPLTLEEIYEIGKQAKISPVLVVRALMAARAVNASRISAKTIEIVEKQVLKIGGTLSGRLSIH